MGTVEIAEKEQITIGELELLTEKQRKFVDAYIDTKGNATQAAGIAGYAYPHPEGHRLLQNATVRTAIEERLKRQHLSQNQVLALLSQHATADIADFMEIDPTGRAFFDWNKAKASGKTHLIKKYHPTRNGCIIEMVDSQNALMLIGKYFALWTDKVDISTSEIKEEIRRRLGNLAENSAQ